MQALCQQKKLSAEGKKYECVKRLVEKVESASPPAPLKAYSGELSSVPESITGISKLSVCNLREILRFHNILDCGTKDELVIRVGMLKSGRAYLAFQRELEAMVDLVTAVRSIIAAERFLYLEDPRILHKRRKFATPAGSSVGTKRPRDSASIPARKHSSLLAVPQGITLDNLEEVLEPLKEEIALYKRQAKNEEKHDVAIGITTRSENGNEIEAMRLVGSRVMAHWSKDEIGKTGWKTGKIIKMLQLSRVSILATKIIGFHIMVC